MKITALLIAAWMLSRYTFSADSAGVSLELLVGAGSYTSVTRDCNGDVLSRDRVPYTEVGGALTGTLGPVRARIAGGRTTAPVTAGLLNGGEVEPASITYVAPSLAVPLRHVELGLGYVFAVDARPSPADVPHPGVSDRLTADELRGTPQVSIRIGREDRVHVTAQYAWDLPASAGTGLTDIGVGFASPGAPHRYWAGVGVVPDEALLFGAKGDLRLAPHVVLLLRGHVALSGETGYGGALGTRITF